MKTIAVFLSDGFEMIEALTPVDYLRRAKLNVITVAVPACGKKESNIVVSSHNVSILADKTFSEYCSFFDENSIDALILPGGLKGAAGLSECAQLLKHIEKCYDAGKFICAICASPAVVLGKTSVLEGRKWTCYPGMKNEAPGKYSSLYQESRVVVDGNLITACAAGASEEFTFSLLENLVDFSEKEQIAKGCCVI